MIPSLQELLGQLNTDRQFYSFIKRGELIPAVIFSTRQRSIFYQQARHMAAARMGRLEVDRRTSPHGIVS